MAKKLTKKRVLKARKQQGHKNHFETLEIARRTLKRTIDAKRIRWREITKEVQEVVSYAGITIGNVVVQTFHTTTGIVLNENEKGLIATDLPRMLGRLVPKSKHAHDRAERILALGPSEPINAASHLMAMLGARESIQLIVREGQVLLGRWQAIMFFDFDAENHESRTVAIYASGTV